MQLSHQNQKPIYLFAVQQTVDQVPTPNLVDKSLDIANSMGLTYKEFIIDPLSAGWNTPLAENHFRSGNSPLEAIEVACEQLREGIVDIIVISGEDNLKTGYTSKIRREMMEIYPNLTLLEAYTQLARTWCQKHNIETSDFIELARQLFNNYSKTYAELQYAGNLSIGSTNSIDRARLEENSEDKNLDEKWFAFVTDLFCGVDCANPVIDYSGKIMLTTREIAEQLLSVSEESANKVIEIVGIATCTLPVVSGIEGIPEIAKYDHLRQSFELACKTANIDFIQLYKDNNAYLEVYTCFPVVPLAFLYSTEIATNLEDVKTIISNYPLTVTGGMNLAKAPWNLPVLRAIIALYNRLKQNDAISIAGVHGNGGLGEKQGFMLMETTS